MTSRRIIRIVLWLGALLLWAWAGSVFTPWAADYSPRLWLYDVLFYARYALGAWALIEAGLLWRALSERRIAASTCLVSMTLLLVGACAALNWQALHRHEAGWKLRVQWSMAALEAYERPIYADRRHRAGWLLIDTQRTPCDDQPWLWLGRPFGAGSGIGLALVHSLDGAPRTPSNDDHRFLSMHAGWWLAYQRLGASDPAQAECVPGTIVTSHQEGLRFRGE